jgi:hypothetical protein
MGLVSLRTVTVTGTVTAAVSDMATAIGTAMDQGAVPVSCALMGTDQEMASAASAMMEMVAAMGWNMLIVTATATVGERSGGHQYEWNNESRRFAGRLDAGGTAE